MTSNKSFLRPLASETCFLHQKSTFRIGGVAKNDLRQLICATPLRRNLLFASKINVSHRMGRKKCPPTVHFYGNFVFHQKSMFRNHESIHPASVHPTIEFGSSAAEAVACKLINDFGLGGRGGKKHPMKKKGPEK